MYYGHECHIHADFEIYVKMKVVYCQYAEYEELRGLTLRGVTRSNVTSEANIYMLFSVIFPKRSRRIVLFFSLCRNFDPPISCITKDSSTIEELGEKHNLYKVHVHSCSPTWHTCFRGIFCVFVSWILLHFLDVVLIIFKFIINFIHIWCYMFNE